MASIEERAEEFADAMVKGALGTRNDYYDSYIKGAIDQRKIELRRLGHYSRSMRHIFTLVKAKKRVS